MIKVKIFVLVLAFCMLNAKQFYPIQAGSLVITKHDFQSNSQTLSCIQRQIKLQTPIEIFDQNQNITILSSITQLNINYKLGIQFTYELVTINNQKLVQYKITRKNQLNIPDQFLIQIDFLIAQGLRVGRLNMTSFQEHIQNMSLSEQQKDQRDKEVHNELFLFPNGFSQINITDNIMYSYISTVDMYVIHYMTELGQSVQQGWINTKYFIMFSTLLLPKYPFGNRTCKSVITYHQHKKFSYKCKSKQIVSYFFGLAGFNGSYINGGFQLTKKGFHFNVKEKSQNSAYGVYGIPIKLSQKFKFIDNRKLKIDNSSILEYFVDFEDIKSYSLAILIIAVGCGAFGFMFFLLTCCQKTGKKSFTKSKEYADLNQEKQGHFSQQNNGKNSGGIVNQQKKIQTQSEQFVIKV